MQARSARTIRGVLWRLIAAGMAWLLPASAALAEPAMWIVKDADSTIYLLGTFHLVKPETRWRSDKIEAAFRDSDELWLEASEQGDSALLHTLVLKHGVDLARPLSSKLGAKDWARVAAAASKAGLPARVIEGMRPWMAALTLAVAPVMKEGYDPAKGVDKQLEASARASNKIVKTFETPEQQLMLFAALPEEMEIAFLLQTLDEVADGTDYVDRMAEAWIAGDTDGLESMTLTRMKGEAPELYESLFVRRNMDWSDQIAALMQGAGTSFVAVGAGHLVGERSVQALLGERGFDVAPF